MADWYYAKETTYTEEDLKKKMKESAGSRTWLSWNEIYNIGYKYMVSARECGQIKDYESMLYHIFIPENLSDPKKGRWYFNDPS